MFRYLLKRILIFIPALLIISLIAFGLSKMAPGDPVANSLGSEVEKEGADFQKMYEEKAKELSLDRPAFYGTITSKAYPDTLYKFTNYLDRHNLKKLIAQYGNWPAIETYFHSIKALDFVSAEYKKAGGDRMINLRSDLQLLYTTYKDKPIESILGKIESQIAGTDSIALMLQQIVGQDVNNLVENYAAIKTNSNTISLYIPSVRWYGFDNQYHNWLKKVMALDFGQSYRTRDNVWTKLQTPLFWTLLLNFTALFFAFLIAVPIGIFSAIRKSSFFDRFINLGLFMLYALPTFWIATMLVVFFTTKEYGAWTDIFASIGIGRTNMDDPFWTRFWIRAPHFILPVICLTYPSLAFISRQMRGGMLDVLNKDYIRTAKAKGLSEKMVIKNHALRNALFPLISLFAIAFPSALAGSVVIEVIFNIPGLGSEMVAAIFSQDWPVVFSVLYLTAIFTLVANLIADIFYVLADPRVDFSN